MKPNACTGQQGAEDARTMAADITLLVQCSADDAQVCSTGVIGAPLPMDVIQSGLVKAYSQLSPMPSQTLPNP